MRQALSSLAVALCLAGFTAEAAAEIKVAPLPNGVRVHTYTEEASPKYQLFDAPTGATHPGHNMNWFYNDANRPSTITKASAISQIQASMAKWTAVCNISFTYKGETTTGFSLSASPASFDGVNVIGWDATTITAPTTGITNVAWDSTNTIIDAEIRFNAAYSATVTAFDATATHEVGHSLGLQHSDIANQVMSGPPLTTYTGLTALQSDDIAGCVHLYGAPAGGGGGGTTPPQDQQAPSIPTNVTATAASTTQINLTWTASTDNVGVASYKVYVGATLAGTVSGTSAAVTSLSPGTTYSFKVAACDAAANCSGQSSAATATTLTVDTQPPSVPMNLTATPLSETQIRLAWSASTDNVGVASYDIYVNGSLLGAFSGTATSTTVNGFSPGMTYSFTINACDAANNCSAQSSATMATTMAVAATCTGTQPANDTQTQSCPAGQTGLITQSRSYSCVGTTWTPGAYQTTSNTCTAVTAGATTTYQDMWWAGSTENGWGLTITQHTNALFLAWYIYDASGNPTWIVLPSGTWDAAHTTYSGALYIPSGSWFGNYDSSRFAANASVGTASVTFANSSAGTLVFTVNGVTTTKSITRLLFGVANNAPITDYTDLWWGGNSENGWGVALTQQYHNIFAAWYTYDANGKTTWYVMPDGTWTGNTYTGTLYSTTSKPVIGAAYDASALVVTAVGNLTLSFANANSATMTYTVNGITQSKAITRQPF